MNRGALTPLTRVNFGVGAVAFGVKDMGFSFFLLIYYQQVLGLDAALASLALTIAIMVDAVTDLLIGYGSDNLKSRWGRRHPLMYAAAIPTAIAFYYLWNPPWVLSDYALFAYLMGMAILVRTLITFYEVPSSALSAELSLDYDERTRLMAYRFAFGLWGGLVLMFAAYTYLLVPAGNDTAGTLNQAGYESYGALAAVVMLVAMIWSAVGTHARIPDLPKADLGARGGWRTVYRHIGASLSNKSFLAAFVSRIFSGVAAGLSANLSIYFATFFWALRSDQIRFFPLMALVSVTLASALAPAISRRFNKKRVALATMLFSILWAPLPLILRLTDLFPENGDPALLPLLLGHALIEGTAAVTAGIMFGAMIADIVEDAEVVTGRRNEGLFFAANGFAGKLVSGAGILLAGLVLSVVDFPEQAQPTSIELDRLTDLAWYFVSLVATLYIAAWIALFFYGIDRDRHQRNLDHIKSS